MTENPMDSWSDKRLDREYRMMEWKVNTLHDGMSGWHDHFILYFIEKEYENRGIPFPATI